MHNRAELKVALQKLPRQALKGYFYRVVEEAALYQHDPPNPLYALGPSRSGQRFTPSDGPPALYVAQHYTTALAESAHAITSSLYKAKLIKPLIPLVVFAINVNLKHVLDLTDNSVIKALGTSIVELKGPWAQQMKNGALVPTHILANIAYSSGRFQAIKYWSVEEAGGINLVIWTRRIRTPSFVEVFDPSGRLAARIPQKR